MKLLLVCIFLSTSFRALADTENYKPDNQCDFFRDISVEGCRKLAVSIFGEQNISSKESMEFQTHCAVASVSANIVRPGDFVLEWAKISNKTKKEIIDILWDKYTKSSNTNHKDQINVYIMKCMKESQSGIRNVSTDSSDFDLIKKNFPMPIKYTDEKIINVVDKLKPLVENFINNYPQSKLLFELQVLLRKTSRTYIDQLFLDQEKHIYKNATERTDAAERYGLNAVSSIDGKIFNATALLTASYSKNPKIISCAIGENVKMSCMDTDYFNGIGFEKMAYAITVAGGLGRELAKKKGLIFFTSAEKDKICSSILAISFTRGANLVKKQLEECSKK